MTSKEQRYCSNCGAPATIKKREPVYDNQTGTVEYYVLRLKCTAHKFLHIGLIAIERVENE